MYTQCPHCQTCFRISEAHLKAARGKVRCGSCQEVFDASGHLYTKLPAIPENMIPPADDISISPEDLARVEHEHIDLSATSVKGETKIPTKQADQSEFMQSTIGTNSRYNNLDDMPPVSIPGELDFGDSILKFGKPSEQQTEEKPASGNPYEDVESKESPASSEEVDQIRDLYTAADELLHSDDGSEDNQDDIDKHIDELLAFTRSLDKNKDQAASAIDDIEDDEFDDFDSLDDLDKPEIKPAAAPPNDESSKKVKEETINKNRDRSIEFNALDLSIEPFTKEQSTFTDSMLGVKDPEPHLAFKHEPASKPSTKQKQEHAQKEPARKTDNKTDALFDFDDASNDIVEYEDALPSTDQEIPRALRRSLETSEAPERPLAQTFSLVVLIFLLVAGLITQIILFRSSELVHMSPALEPVLANLCDVLPCRYSGPADVSKISLTNRDVRSHPSQKNALLISAAFVNQAGFDQPYPDILVTLSDLSGNIVANRRFTPQEYLDKMYNRFLLMESGTPVHITLPVLDPGDDAINFEFTFL